MQQQIVTSNGNGRRLAGPQLGALARRYRSFGSDPVLEEFNRALKSSGMSISAVARKSGVSAGTLYRWRDGLTRRPQHITLVFAFRAMGWRFGLERLA